MRFDTPVYFRQIKQGQYDASTGNYGEDIITEVKRYAAVTNSSVETMNLIYGQIKQGSLTIRLQNHYTWPFDYIRVRGKLYRVDSERLLRVKNIFVVSEVQ